MPFPSSLVRRIGVALIVGAALLGGLGAPAAYAAGAGKATTVTLSADHTPTRYFVEFRGRSAASYGHMYVMYGIVNARGEIVESKIAGLHPAGDAENCYNCSLLAWTVGHVIFVPSETGASDGDLEEKYVTARYRVWVNRGEYLAVARYIRKFRARAPLWNALWKNCVGFGRDVATFMRLKIPPYIWMEPEDFVNALRKLNGMPREQMPLRDAANSLKSDVRLAAPAPARHQVARQHAGADRTAHAVSRYGRLNQRAQSSPAQRREWSHGLVHSPFDSKGWTDLKRAFAEVAAPPRR